MSELLFAISITAIALKLFAIFSDRFGLVDIPNDRSFHTKAVPRGAGMVFGTIALIVSGYLYPKIYSQMSYVISSIVIVIFVGILDDRYRLSPKVKFLAIAVSSMILYFNGLKIDYVGTYMHEDIYLSWLSLPFTYFAVAGFTNAMNLIDGLDGLCATIAIGIFSLYVVIGYKYDDPFIMFISLGFIATLIAFLLYNWYPASLFMGDSGSLSLGFAISVISIKALEYLPAPTILYIGAIPILDTFFVIARRKSDGLGAMTPDRCHLHHILHKFTRSVPLTVTILLAIQIVFFAIAYFVHKLENQIYALILFLVLFRLIYESGIFLIKKSKKECFSEQRRQ